MNKKMKEKKSGAVEYGDAKKRADRDTGFSSKAINRPDGMGYFKIESKPGIHKIDILPYIAGKGNECCDKGKVWYERTYFIHRNVGPQKDTYVCPARSFNKRCPICEERTKMEQKHAGKDKKVRAELLRPYNTSERQIFLVREYDKNGQPGPMLFWEISNYAFGRLLDQRVKNDEDARGKFFYPTKDGKTLTLSVEEKAMGDGTFPSVSAIDFEPRKKEHRFGEEILEEAPCLDDMLKEVDYKTLKKAWNAAAVEDEDDDKDEEDEDLGEDDDEPKKKSKKKSKKDEEDDDDDSDDEDDSDDDDDGDGGDSEDDGDSDDDSEDGDSEDDEDDDAADSDDDDEDEDSDDDSDDDESDDDEEDDEDDDDDEEEDEKDEDDDSESEDEDDDDEDDDEPKKKKGKKPQRS
jgi:hypothetical protein